MADARYSCRRCRCVLFENVHLVGGHHISTDCTLYLLDYTNLPLWIQQAVEKGYWTKGKLHCPECESRIGAFNFVNLITCGCNQDVSPAVYFVRSKLDEKIPHTIYEQSFELSQSFSTIACEGLVEDDNGNGSNLMNDEKPTSPTKTKELSTATSSTIQRRNSCSTIFENQIFDPQILPIYPEVYDDEEFSSSIVQRTEENSPYDEVLLTQNNHCKNCRLLDEQLLNKSTSGSSSHLYYEVNGRQTRSLITIYDSGRGVDDSGCGHQRACGNCQTPDKSRKRMTADDTMTQSFKEEEELDDQHQCPVCLDIFYEPHQTKCLHLFCAPCLRQLYKSSNKKPLCPLCRCRIYQVEHLKEFEENIKKLYPVKHQDRLASERTRPINRQPLPNPLNVRFSANQNEGQDGGGQNNVGIRNFIQVARYSLLILVMVLTYLFGTVYNLVRSLLKEISYLLIAFLLMKIISLIAPGGSITYISMRCLQFYVLYRVVTSLKTRLPWRRWRLRANFRIGRIF